MPKVIFITLDQQRIEIECPAGYSVMQAAVNANVPGIDGDCGGSCSCATCHVHVDPSWRGRVGEVNEVENEMLAFAVDVTEASRLSCQIILDDHLDGLVVSVAEH